MIEEAEHAQNLLAAQSQLAGVDTGTPEGRAILLRVSGSDQPYANLDEMHADEPDPYGESLQADFDVEQAKDEE